MDRVALEWRRRQGDVVEPPSATDEQICRVHAPRYLGAIESMAGRATAIDADTYTSPETAAIARLAAGAAVHAVDRVMARPDARAFALVRPPGHHAERGRAMGFCFFNNVAIAAAHARMLGAARVAIVDYDVHHGNGTQHIFESDPSVLYVSMHQFPFYPGTGDADEIGIGPGAGFTVNVPLEVGATDRDYQVVCERIVAPIVRQFEPALVILSAGFDAHERDPLAGMRVTTDGFRAMTAMMRQVADECCGGRLVAVTEGGYDLAALTDSCQAVVDVLGARQGEPPAWPETLARSSRGAVAAARTASALGGFWKLTG